jgi:hypothetical protein
MSFREAWIQGLIAVFDCDRDVAECIVADDIADTFFDLDAEPSQVLSLFTYPVHPESDVPVCRLSVEPIGEVVAPPDPTPNRSPFCGFNLNYFTSALAAMPKPPRR